MPTISAASFLLRIGLHPTSTDPGQGFRIERHQVILLLVLGIRNCKITRHAVRDIYVYYELMPQISSSGEVEGKTMAQCPCEQFRMLITKGEKELKRLVH